MYLHCEHGFLEIDKWDGSPIPSKSQTEHLQNFKGDVLVVRARERAALACMFPRHRIFHTPEWDYAYRVYASRIDVGIAFLSVVDELQYRNFKSKCDAESGEYVGSEAQSELAHGIWEAAHTALVRKKR